MNLRNELQNLISGTGDQATENLIQAACDYLRKGAETSGKFKENQLFTKEHETEVLKSWVESNNLWFLHHDESLFIASGAEQRVYLDEDVRFVYKLNDSIFYKFWLDYFHSLLLHNYFFAGTK